jgi:hypothetical protein
MAAKEDRRVLYTKMFLREALLELMREKPVDRITPTELCRRAGINRNDTYDMVLDFVVEGSLAVLRYWAQNDMKKSPQEIAGLIDKISNGGISVFESCTDQ